MNDDGARFDSRFDGNGPFRDTPEAGGISLESALRDFGPAAIDDLIPRLTALAATLDAAHEAGAVHGGLHPSTVIITDETTSLLSGDRSSAHLAHGRPYLAPEVADGVEPLPASDQFALAAIAYEWLFGRPIDHPAERPVEVRSMPGVDREALSRAFTRALAPRPSDRFASCTAFCAALSASIVTELPLTAAAGHDDHDLDPIAIAGGADAPASDFSIRAPGSGLREPVGDELADGPLRHSDPVLPIAEPGSRSPEPGVPSWNPSAAAVPAQDRSQRFGGLALILATLVGAVFGFAAGYMAKPRALQSPAPRETTIAQGTDAPIQPGASGASSAFSASGASVTEKMAPPPTPATPRAVKATAPKTRQARDAPQAPRVGALVVESRPVGASITINGRVRGKTPLVLSDLEPGEYRVQMLLPGFRNFATTVRVVAGERARAAASLTALEQE